jgi:hypothetical protein
MDGRFIYNLGFFQINNDCINSKFLSRFIARKFAQHYRFYELINPIRRELKTVWKFTKGGHKAYFMFRLRDKIEFTTTLNHRRDIFKSFLIYLFMIFTRYSLGFFFRNKSIFSLEMISLYLYIYTEGKMNYIYFIHKYMTRRGALSFFFSCKDDKYSRIFNNFFYLFKNSVILLAPKIDFSGFFDYIIQHFHINKKIISNNYRKANINLYYFKYVQFFFNRYLKYKY